MPKASYEIMEDKVSTVYDMIINRNKDKTFISKKRQIFDGWRRAIYNQRRFMKAITTFYSKGLYQKGFNTIVWGANYHKGKKLVEKVLTRHFLTRYKHSFVKECFSLWKEQLYIEISSNLNEKIDLYNNTVKSQAV